MCCCCTGQTGAVSLPWLRVINLINVVVAPRNAARDDQGGRARGHEVAEGRPCVLEWQEYHHGFGRFSTVPEDELR
jgi:hypothetical protein